MILRPCLVRAWLSLPPCPVPFSFPPRSSHNGSPHSWTTPFVHPKPPARPIFSAVNVILPLITWVAPSSGRSCKVTCLVRTLLTTPGEHILHLLDVSHHTSLLILSPALHSLEVLSCPLVYWLVSGRAMPYLSVFPGLIRCSTHNIQLTTNICRRNTKALQMGLVILT